MDAGATAGELLMPGVQEGDVCPEGFSVFSGGC